MFLTSPLDGERSVSHPRKSPSTYLIGGSMGPRVALEAVAKTKEIPASDGKRIPVVQLVAY